ncbi:murein hydrolase activator EnvC family protein [Zunongwangia sp. HGR-M22]|uniref:murein hydrolase activator EnvC family protein n=1 Tax=Zunongwangia sp. HGR-M22 TaxID=3015168 RepID=UPI0022DD5A23|nr:peptidoglycan DD-metalloendopeptidase family protein [Zunongwangia sp. HGR-M22]WBL25631.1 peptidoglycan DD-metalloendopeptidase family protein [Zunongwangia sp. HGR-M22]
MKLNFFKYIVVAATFLVATNSFSQSTREALEKKRMELQNEIRRISDLRSNNKKKEKSILNEVQDLNQQIKSTENLIQVTNRQASLLTKEMNENEAKIAKFRKELEELKADYAVMIKKSYRSKSQQSRIMFLLSSESFLQAYKRLEYLKQYTEYRKQQGEQIKTRTVDLQRLNTRLSNQKEEKDKLIAENRKTRARLEENKKAQQELMKTITAKEGQFASQIKKAQQEIDEIERKIDAMIKASIAETNKKSGSAKRDVFELSPEAKALAKDFASNKGKLPWPVKAGTISMKFGKQPHPVVRNISINNSGINIDTDKGGKARAVFEGTVSEVQILKGANKAVMLRHGDYITIYDNLESVAVRKGDYVSTGQELGVVATSKSTGKTTLHFLIFQNTNKYNPESWIINR